MKTSIDEYTEDNYLYYINDIAHFPLLTREQEHELICSIRQGDRQAYEYFYSCNLKLVVSISKKYIGSGIPLMDLIQAGNIGLIRAVEKFNHMSGYKFSTYATPWIHQGIRRLLHQKRLIWTPEHIDEKIIKMRKAEAELGIDATDERIAEKVQISVERLQELRQWSVRVGTVSFEMLCGEEESDDQPLHLANILSDDRDTQEAQRTSERHELRAEIDKALDMLNTREREIVRLRFGLDDQGSKTLDVVGKAHHITKERARQIEERALQKLTPLLADVAKRMGAAI